MVRAHDGISRGQGEVVILPWPESTSESTSSPEFPPTSRENLRTKLGRSFVRFVLSASSETQGQLQSSSKILKHFPSVDLGITVVSVLQNTRGATLGRERAHYSENKSVRSKNVKNFPENSRETVSALTIVTSIVVVTILLSRLAAPGSPKMF